MTVDELIVKSIKKVIHLNYESEEPNNPEMRLIYPRYREDRGGEKKISEHEIKQVLIQVLNEEDNKHKFFYSVESPTENKYVFKSKEKCVNCFSNTCPRMAGENDRKVSGRTDLCLYKIHKKKFKKYALIEFKEDNPDNRGICQDFLKLAMELNYENSIDKKGYFVLVLDGFGTITKNGLFGHDGRNGKLSKSLNFIKSRLLDKTINVFILTLRNSVEIDLGNNIEITTGYYNFDLNKNTKIVYGDIHYTTLIKYNN